MAEYALQKLDTAEEQYQVHNITCKKLPAADASRYLGSYATATAAYNKAMGLYNSVNYCPDCVPAQ